jgi:hypothetical protein
MRVLRKAAVLVLLGLVLGLPWASAADGRPERASGKSMRAVWRTFDLLTPLWNLLGSGWNKEVFVGDSLGGHAAAGAGCTIDPLGCPQTPSIDEGCIMDPLGGCVPNR